MRLSPTLVFPLQPPSHSPPPLVCRMLPSLHTAFRGAPAPRLKLSFFKCPSFLLQLKCHGLRPTTTPFLVLV